MTSLKSLSLSSPLYPEIEPFQQNYLKVSSLHTLYYEESGNVNGKPILYLHGGPGGGVSPKDRRYFNPKTYRIILFDQRGAGKSTPPACLEENTIDDLIQDIETLRNHLKIEQWIVFGGSWGSTLSLYYAQNHPNRVKALILRGIFLVRKEEIDWLYEKGGCEWLYADAWEQYLAPIPENERNNMLQAYSKRLIDSSNEAERIKCARAWSKWELYTSRLEIDEETVKKIDEDTWALQFARIECHYFIHHGFMPEGYLLKNVDKIRHIPCVIVQGRYDVVCPMKSSWELHQKWPEAEYRIVQLAGHSARDLEAELVRATQKFESLP